MLDSSGERWFTIAEAVRETGMSETTVKGWIRDGLRSYLIAGKRYVPETDLFARLRQSLTGSTRVKTRWKNSQQD